MKMFSPRRVNIVAAAIDEGEDRWDIYGVFMAVEGIRDGRCDLVMDGSDTCFQF